MSAVLNAAAALAALAAAAAWTAAPAADLLSVYEQAKQNDPQYAAAQAEYRAAREAKPQARSAVLPQVTLQASVAENEVDQSPGGESSFRSDEWTLALTQTLFNWREFAGLDRADAVVAQAEANLAAAEQNLITRVAQAYFDVLSAEDGLRFARAELRAIERQLEQARQRFDVGLIPITDVKEAQASYDLAVSREIDAENQLENAREALRTIIGEPPGTLAAIAGELRLDRPEPAEPAAWVERALEQNPEYLAARSGAEAAREGIRQARSGYYPDVELTASHTEGDNAGGAGRTGETTTDRIGVQLTWALFSGFGTQSQTREARAQFEQAKSGVVQARRNTEQSTRDAYRAVAASISQVEALRQAVDSNRARVESTRAGFRVGTRTAVDVLNALRDLYAAQRDLADARYNYIVSRLRLKQAAGALTIDDVRMVNSRLSEEASGGRTEPDTQGTGE
jgi:outer membrane protein